MASFGGIASDNFESIKTSLNTNNDSVADLSGDKLARVSYDDTYCIEEIELPISTSWNYNIWSMNNHGTFGGFRYFSYLDILYDKIWISPKVISSFILEDTYYSILIWNSYLDQVADITDISVVSPEGTALTPMDFPASIPRNFTSSHTLTVYKDGPSAQNTTYTWEIDGSDYELLITGTRVLPFLFPLNWKNNYTFILEEKTILGFTEKLNEQRRPMQHTSYRSSRFKILTYDATESEKFHNFIQFTKDKVIGVPIYQDVMITTTTLIAGVSLLTINPEIDMNYYYGLERAEYLAIIDHRELTGELKKIDTVTPATNTILLENPLTQNFDRNTAMIYPIYLGLLQVVSYKAKTDHIIESSINCIEFRHKDV